MSRIPVIDPATATPEQRAVMEEIVSGPHGRIVGPYNAWLQSPEFARRARGLSEIIRFGSPLPERLKELAILMTGYHWRAEFEFYAHAKLGRKAGLADAVITALAAGQRPDFAADDETLVYDFCAELLQHRRVSDATYARAVDALGQSNVVTLVTTVGYYCMVSLTLNAFEVPLPDGEPSPFAD